MTLPTSTPKEKEEQEVTLLLMVPFQVLPQQGLPVVVAVRRADHDVHVELLGLIVVQEPTLFSYQRGNTLGWLDNSCGDAMLLPIHIGLP